MSSSEDEFDQFRKNLDERRALKVEFDVSIQRIEAFLQARGIDTVPAVIKANMATVASSKLMVDTAYQEKPHDPAILGVKKKLQAYFFLIDYPDVWQELIDIEFAGPSLQPEIDTDIIADEYRKLIENTSELEQSSQETMLSMMDFLDGQNYEVLEDDQAALWYLVFLYDIPRLQPQDKLERA